MLPQAALIKPGSGGGGSGPGSLASSSVANQSGALPQGVTVYLASGVAQSGEYPLYIAQTNETVSKFQMVSLTGNGAAHSDVYTVVKNGVATTMTFTVTNGSSGSTTSNPVSLVVGDRIAISVLTGASTAAADILAQLTIVNA